MTRGNVTILPTRHGAKHRAVFVDKDGTLIHDLPHNVDVQRITFREDAISSLRQLQETGYLIIVVTNQSGVAHGCFDEAAVAAVKDYLKEELLKQGVRLDGFYHCPHHPQGTVPRYSTGCSCRKPAPGMLLQAAEDFEIDLNASWMLGDILNDVEAGCLAGCRTILLDVGNETEWDLSPDRVPNWRAPSFGAAAEIILANSFSHASASFREALA